MRNYDNLIAIVGVGAFFANSYNAQDFWRNIVRGNDLITDVPPSHWLIDDYYDKDPKAPDKTYCKRGSFLPDVPFDPIEWGIPPGIISVTHVSQLLALMVAKQVLLDAYNGNLSKADLSRAAIFIGVTGFQESVIPGISRMQYPIWRKVFRECGLSNEKAAELEEQLKKQYVPWQENTFPGLLPNIIPGRIANRLNFGGTNCSIDAACGSSLAAIVMAVNELQLHRSDFAVAGGAETGNDVLSFMCFSKTPALSPSEECRPFSEDGDGTLLGEGFCMLALKRLEDAESQGDPIYGLIRGIGTSSDGRSKSIYAPVAAGQMRALERAYEMAGYGPETVELVEAHGTGTKAGDAEEFSALKSVFSKYGMGKKAWCALGSIKSQIGHTKGTAGSAGFFKALMALHHNVLPPTIKVTKPNPKLEIENSPFYLNTRARPWIKDSQSPRRSSVSSFGFGGTNFHITLEEYKGPGKRAKRLNISTEHLVLLSEKSGEALSKKCQDLIVEADSKDRNFLPYFARQSYQNFSTTDPMRLALIVKDGQDFIAKLRLVLDHLKSAPQKNYLNSDIIYVQGHRPDKLAFLFAGQGSQYLEMGAGLAMAFEASCGVWNQAAAISLDNSLTLNEVVFPLPVFTDEERKLQKNLLNNTIWTQPALAGMAFSQLALLDQLGLVPEYVGGHSFGEVIALAYARAFDFPALIKLARKRGELLSENPDGAPGGMIAILQPIEKTLAMLKNWNLELVPANFNSPFEVVLSGRKEEIEKAKQYCGRDKVPCQELPVSNAFHSPAMKPKTEQFRTYLETVPMQLPRCPVFSNASTAPYPQDIRGIKEMLSEQLAIPVRFVEMIEAMYRAGVRTFLEVGPGQVLTGLVNRILEGKDIEAFSLDRKGGDGISSLLHALGRLAVLGFTLNFEALFSQFAEPLAPELLERYKRCIMINGAIQNKPVIKQEGKLAQGLSSNAAISENSPAVSSQSGGPILSSISEKNDGDFMKNEELKETNKTQSKSDPRTNIDSLVEVYQQFHQHIIHAHHEYQNNTAECHKKFLETLEHSLKEIHELYSGKAKGQVINGSTPLTLAAADSIKSHGEAILPQAIPAIPEVAKQDLSSLAPPSTSAANGQLQKEERVEVKKVPEKAALVNESTSSPVRPLDKKTAMMADILGIVAAATGYPVESLSMEMEIEADLGIDSIKRVEILSAIQAKYPGLPELDLGQMASLRTLQQMNDFIEKAVITKAAAS